MLVLVINKEPRPLPPWHSKDRHRGCLTHWIDLNATRSDVVMYTIMFVRGYATLINVETGRELHDILHGNAMWGDETYDVFVLKEEGPVTELAEVPGKQRFLILARPAKPVDPGLTYERVDAEMKMLASSEDIQVFTLVEDVIGYAILLNATSHDQIRSVLEPLALTGYANYEIMPLGTLEGHRTHLKDLGHQIEF